MTPRAIKNDIIKAAKHFKAAIQAGDLAAVVEDCGDTPERSSDSWYEEAAEYQNILFGLLDHLEASDDR